jgi:hypothetical protein
VAVLLLGEGQLGPSRRVASPRADGRSVGPRYVGCAWRASGTSVCLDLLCALVHLEGSYWAFFR